MEDPEQERKRLFWKGILPTEDVFHKILKETFENAPISEEGIVHIVKKINYKFPCFFQYAGFINDYILFGFSQTTIHFFDLDSMSEVYHKNLKIDFLNGIKLSDNYLFIYSIIKNKIIIFDYIEKNYTIRSYPKEYEFYDLIKMNDNEVAFLNYNTIYVYSINSNHFLCYKYGEIPDTGVIQGQTLNSESFIILGRNKIFDHHVCVYNHKTQKSKEYVFPKKKELIFVDVTNGLVYDENEVYNKDKTFIKIYVLDFRKYELFNYNCLFLLRQIPFSNHYEVFTIPNSQYICLVYWGILFFFDIQTNKLISFCRASLTYIVLVSPKYIISDCRQYKILRNLL